MTTARPACSPRRTAGDRRPGGWPLPRCGQRSIVLQPGGPLGGPGVQPVPRPGGGLAVEAGVGDRDWLLRAPGGGIAEDELSAVLGWPASSRVRRGGRYEQAQPGAALPGGPRRTGRPPRRRLHAGCRSHRPAAGCRGGQSARTQARPARARASAAAWSHDRDAPVVGGVGLVPVAYFSRQTSERAAAVVATAGIVAATVVATAPIMMVRGVLPTAVAATTAGVLSVMVVARL